MNHIIERPNYFLQALYGPASPKPSKNKTKTEYKTKF
jgi:hypothetical protein